MRMLSAVVLSVCLSSIACQKANVPGPDAPVVKTANAPSPHFTATFDAADLGSDWEKGFNKSPPKWSSTEEVIRPVFFVRKAGTATIVAIDLDFFPDDLRTPVAIARYDLAKWKQTYPAGAFGEITVTPDGNRATYSFECRCERAPEERITQTYIRFPGVKKPVLVDGTVYRIADRPDVDKALKTFVESLSIKPL